jgi:hypothetical protein
MAAKVREEKTGRMGAQHVPQMLPQAVAPREILVVATAYQVPPVGSVLFLPSETQGWNLQNA